MPIETMQLPQDEQLSALSQASTSDIGERRGHLLWLFPASFEHRLDSATWLDTTRELRRLGWQVTLVSMGPYGVRHYQGVEVLTIPKPDVYLFGQVLFHLGVVRYLFNHFDEVDIVFFHQESGVWLLPMRFVRLLKRTRRPLFVMDTRDINDLKPGDIKVMLRSAFEGLNHKLAGLLADGQTTITSRFVELVKIRETKIWGTWPSGVDLPRFAEPAETRKWPGDADPIRLVYVGIVLEKRHLVPLCRAVQRANENGYSFELVVAGDGPDMASLTLCAEGSPESVKLLEPVPHTAVPALLATMHVGVTSLPDIDDVKYGASSPIKLFEYMASGLPVLATRNVCHSDVVGDGGYTFWVEEPTERGILAGLEQIWRQRADLQSLGREAQLEAEQWTWAAAARKLDEALRKGLQ
jgi:glycosyltransferase involved in cell wall biosynthesis